MKTAQLFLIVSLTFGGRGGGANEDLRPPEGGGELEGDLTAYYIKNIKLQDSGAGREKDSRRDGARRLPLGC